MKMSFFQNGTAFCSMLHLKATFVRPPFHKIYQSILLLSIQMPLCDFKNVPRQIIPKIVQKFYGNCFGHQNDPARRTKG